MLALILALTSVAPLARAESDVLRSVDALYFHRDQGQNLGQSISKLDDLIASGAQSGPELYWRRCRSFVRLGESRAKKSDRLDDYERAREDCEKSVKLSSSSAQAHFWWGVALGRWGEAKGLLRALFLVQPIRREMQRTLALDPKHGGAHRVLGEMLWQIPAFAGGDKKKALEEFELAVRLSPDYSSNYEPLAQAYLSFGRTEDAIRALRAVAKIKEPADPAEYPGDVEDARKELSVLTAH